MILTKTFTSSLRLTVSFVRNNKSSISNWNDSVTPLFKKMRLKGVILDEEMVVVMIVDDTWRDSLTTDWLTQVCVAMIISYSESRTRKRSGDWRRMSKNQTRLTGFELAALNDCNMNWTLVLAVDDKTVWRGWRSICSLTWEDNTDEGHTWLEVWHDTWLLIKTVVVDRSSQSIGIGLNQGMVGMHLILDIHPVTLSEVIAWLGWRKVCPEKEGRGVTWEGEKHRFGRFHSVPCFHQRNIPLPNSQNNCRIVVNHHCRQN